MLQRYDLSVKSGGDFEFKPTQNSVDNSQQKGKFGHIKSGSAFRGITLLANKNSTTKIVLNRGSLIDYLNTKLESGEKLKKGYFFGLIGRSSDDKIMNAFNKTVNNDTKKLRSAVPAGNAEPRLKQYDLEKIKTFATELTNLLKDSDICSFRNSGPALKNLATALEIFAITGDLAGKFEPIRSKAYGSSEQPDTIEKTFKLALDHSAHGGVHQTIQAMKKARDNRDLEAKLKEIVAYLGA